MKKKILIVAIVIAVAVTCAFAFRKKAAKTGLRAMTVVSIHTFNPLDKTKPVLFLGVNIESYKGDGTFVHHQVGSRGGSRYFYSDMTSTYTTVPGTKTTQVLGTSTEEAARARAQKEDSPMSTAPGFQGVENVHGLPLSVIETTIDGRRYKKWASPVHGSGQMELESEDGLEQIKIVSVTDGYNPDEFERIPNYPKIPKQ